MSEKEVAISDISTMRVSPALMTGLSVLPAQRLLLNIACRNAGQYYWLAIREFSDQG